MKYNEKVTNRMKRIEGQVRGALRMMEEEKEVKDVITQLTAARNALDRTAALIVTQNLEQSIRDEEENGKSPEDFVQEAVNLLVKSR
ncbi:metal-sensitive transcriptional regulator [Oceanobacillus chungangensis]|uniref:Cytoplasmic protein n=1 Tax=Oceanobacillus chungangensis TaxID=1229152 RepID=A0A3D8PNB8_9BACI|nr:metal-sensitive transcriptional regulator [Oceanobacillus chungangensis]RDW16625.1 cytoplasmic protein [Oceanobacillus chungangensis]